MTHPAREPLGVPLHQAAGTLGKAQEKSHLPLPFDVPPGIDWLALRFACRPSGARPGLPANELSLSLFDPLGCRGTRHNNAQRNVLLTDTAATPGFVARPVRAGAWSVVLDVHRVTPGVTVAFDLTVEGGAGALPRVPAWASAPADALRLAERATRRTSAAPPTGGAAWYKGDLHAHTLHSDGHWDVPDLAAAAQREGLDFVTLSDHNTVSGVAELHRHAPAGLVTIGGMELSTFHGHALALGIDRWLEWRVAPPGGPATPAAELFAEVQRAARLAVIAHPMSIGSPWRSGSLWEYAELMPGSFRCMEVWNGNWNGGSHNEQALQLFYLWLNLGHRLVATSGTDTHRDWQPGDHVAFNHVLADERSERGILAGIARGTSYVSDGPLLQVVARAEGDGGRAVRLGGSLVGTPGRVDGEAAARTADAAGVRVDVRWTGCNAGDALRLIADGDVAATEACTPAGAATFPLARLPRWFTLEVRDAQGDLRALTNPIYRGP